MRKLVAAVLLAILLLLSSCVAGDDIGGDVYLRNTYPSITLNYNLGSPTYQWHNLYVENINGAPFGAGGVAHSLLSATHTDTTAGAVTRGDLIAGQGVAPTWKKLAIGASGRFLRSDGTDAGWSNVLLNNNDPIQWRDVGGTPRDVFNLFNWLDILPAQSFDAIWWLGSGTGRTMYLWGDSSTAVSTTKDSPTISLLSTYWNGVSTNWEAKILHDMTASGIAPSSTLKFSIAGATALTLQNNNTVMGANIPGRTAVGANNTLYGSLQVNQPVDSAADGIAVYNIANTRSMRLWVDGSAKSYIDSGATGTANLILNNGGGAVGVGVTSPTAILHLKGSTAAANTASLKIDAGTVAAAPVSGNVESDGVHLFWTDSGGTRRQLDN